VSGESGVLERKSGNISETRKDRGKVTSLARRTARRRTSLFFLANQVDIHAENNREG